jgi:hypothetical protein
MFVKVEKNESGGLAKKKPPSTPMEMRRRAGDQKEWGFFSST